MSVWKPQLRTIGRTKHVDDDSPTDIDDFDLMGSRYHEYSEDSEASEEFLGPEQRPFNLPDASTVADRLGGQLQLSAQLSVRRSATHQTPFVHTGDLSASTARRHARLLRLLQRRAIVTFRKDCLERLSSAASFRRRLSVVVRSEIYQWDQLMQKHSKQVSAVTRLEELCNLCEQLKVHCWHWNGIKQQLHTLPSLQPLRAKLLAALQPLRASLKAIIDCCLLLIERFISCGLIVLAKSDMDTVTRDMLWGVARGIEAYNTILGMYKQKHPCDYDTNEGHGRVVHLCEPRPFVEVMAVLANTRAVEAARLTHKFFTEHPIVLEAVVSGNAAVSPRHTQLSRMSSCSGSPDPATSDYFTGSSARTESVGISVGPPDLSNQMSPIVDFARQEKQFAEVFLSVVNATTSLLRNSKNTRSTSGADGFNVKTHTSRIDPTSSRFSDGARDSPVLEDGSSKRKSILWYDSADASLRAQLSVRYMQLLWKYFSDHLSALFMQPCIGNTFTGDERAHCLRGLGSIVLCGAPATDLIVHTMRSALDKDLFPPDSIPSVVEVVRRLHQDNCLSLSFDALSSALGSASTDKCLPSALPGRDSSSRTAGLLCNALSSLHSLLPEPRQLEPESGVTLCDAEGARAALQQALTVLRVSVDWCASHAQKFTTAWSLTALVVVMYADYQLLCEAAQGLLQRAHDLSAVTHSSRHALAVAPLAQLAHEYALSRAHLKSVQRSMTRQFTEKCQRQATDFFKDNFPVGNVWRKTSASDSSTCCLPLQQKRENSVLNLDAELPSTASEYSEEAVLELLLPASQAMRALSDLPEAQVDFMSRLLTAVFRSWCQVIKSKKVKFSYWGAHQLQQDFTRLSDALHATVEDERVRHKLLQLPLFRQMDAIVLLLKRHNASSSFRPRLHVVPSSQRGFGSDTSFNENKEVESTQRRSRFDIRSSSPNDTEPALVKNEDEWLSLRARKTTWRLSQCFGKK